MASDDVGEVVPVSSSVPEMVAKSELRTSMDYARQYERSPSRFMKDCVQLATLNETVAKECLYALPRKEDGQTKMIEGPSARLAEIILSSWGNCAAGARVSHEDREFVYAQGFFFDLERNVRVTREVRRRITNRGGHRFNADMIAVTANAACSIAQRNAVLGGVPRALWWEAYIRARNVVAGNAETLEKKRSEAIDEAKKFGLPLERILGALGVEGVRDIGVDELVKLHGLMTVVRSEEASIDEAFPSVEAPSTSKPATSGTAVDRLREGLKSSGVDDARAAFASGAAKAAGEVLEGKGGEEKPAEEEKKAPPAPAPMCAGAGCTNESEPGLGEGKLCRPCHQKAAADEAIQTLDAAKKKR